MQRAATPAANNANLLVNTVVLNYMALRGEEGLFGNLFMQEGPDRAMPATQIPAGS